MIHLTKPYFDHKEIDAVKIVLESGWVAGQGPAGNELSEYITKITNTKFAIPVNNCTAGLHLALLALGVNAGDEILVSDYTFPATGHAVLFCGASPRFIDVDLRTYNINPSLIEKKINKKTKAIIVVHQFGQMADMDEIRKIANKYNLNIIEDSACAMGATYKEKPAGSFGDISAFSFHARKNATSGEGGIVVTNNKEYSSIMKSLSCFGIDSAFRRQNTLNIPSFTRLGYNYKLSDINAAIAHQQLIKYPKVLKKRRRLVNLYNTLLGNSELLTLPVEHENNFHVFQTYAVVLDKKINRNKLILSLRDDGIQTQIGTYASHIQPVYKSKDKCSTSLFLFNHSLALPLYYQLKKEEVELVAEKLNFHIQKQLRG